MSSGDIYGGTYEPRFGKYSGNSGRACGSGMKKVLEFNGLWQGDCYRDWFSSEVK